VAFEQKHHAVGEFAHRVRGNPGQRPAGCPQFP
jgi:hypothetical protein